MYVSKIQVSLVRLVRFAMLELLPLCLFWIYEPLASSDPIRKLRSRPPYLEGYLEGYQRTASPRPEGELLPIAYRIAPLNGRLS